MPINGFFITCLHKLLLTYLKFVTVVFFYKNWLNYNHWSMKFFVVRIGHAVRLLSHSLSIYFTCLGSMAIGICLCHYDIYVLSVSVILLATILFFMIVTCVWAGVNVATFYQARSHVGAYGAVPPNFWIPPNFVVSGKKCFKHKIKRKILPP